MKSPKNWREIAEYTSLGLSALGTVVAAATQQTLYVATPLTLTLSLNLLNRQELARRSQQLSHKNERLEQQLLTSSNSITSNFQSLENLNQQINSLNNRFDERPEGDDTKQIKQKLIRLTEGMEQLHLIPEKILLLQAELNLVNEKIENKNKSNYSQPSLAQMELIQGELNEIKQEIELISYLNSEVTQLKDRLQSSNQINYTQHLEDIDVVIADLRNSIDSYNKDIDYQKKLLDNQSQTSVILPQHFNDLNATVTQLQSRIENLDNRTSEALKIISGLSRSISQEVINQTINPFTEELDSVKINLDSLLSSIESINLSDLKQTVTSSASKLMEIDYISEKVVLFHKELNAVNEQLNLNKEHNDNNIRSLYSQLEEVSKEFHTFKPNIQLLVGLNSNINEFNAQLESSSKITSIQSHLEDLDASLSDVHDWINDLNRELSSQKELLENQIQLGLYTPEKLASIEELANQLKSDTEDLNKRNNKIQGQVKLLLNSANRYVNNEELDRTLTRISEEFTSKFDFNIEESIQAINQFIEQTQPVYKYELVIDRPGSRAALMEALNSATERLILVCPWIGSGMNQQVMEKLELRLKQNVRVDIGWGNLKDIEKTNGLSGSIRQKLSNGGYYNALPQLQFLEQKYPKLLNLKILGTHEKFLVCDRDWAMIGSHNFLTSTDREPERELGLKTNDARIVDDLIARFSQAKDLDEKVFYYEDQMPF